MTGKLSWAPVLKFKFEILRHRPQFRTRRKFVNFVLEEMIGCQQQTGEDLRDYGKVTGIMRKMEIYLPGYFASDLPQSILHTCYTISLF